MIYIFFAEQKNYHTFNGLKEHKFIISEFLWIRSPAWHDWVLCSVSVSICVFIQRFILMQVKICFRHTEIVYRIISLQLYDRDSLLFVCLFEFIFCCWMETICSSQMPLLSFCNVFSSTDSLQYGSFLLQGQQQGVSYCELLSLRRIKSLLWAHLIGSDPPSITSFQLTQSQLIWDFGYI